MPEFFEMDEFNRELVEYTGDKKEVVIPNGVKGIHEDAFFNKSKLEKVVLSQSVESISCHAFVCCRKLKSISMPESVRYLDLSAFDGCDALEDLSFEGPFRKIKFSIEGISLAGDIEHLKDKSLVKYFGHLSEKSLLQLIEYCPKVCFYIPSERCTDEFMSKAEKAIINGMCKRAELDTKYVDEDVNLLPELKEWKKKEYDNHLTPIGRLMTAIGEFKDNSK